MGTDGLCKFIYDSTAVHVLGVRSTTFYNQCFICFFLLI